MALAGPLPLTRAADVYGLGVIGYDHRRFLNEFYRGRFPGSFARGLP